MKLLYVSLDISNYNFHYKFVERN